MHRTHSFIIPSHCMSMSHTKPHFALRKTKEDEEGSHKLSTLSKQPREGLTTTKPHFALRKTKEDEEGGRKLGTLANNHARGSPQLKIPRYKKYPCFAGLLICTQLLQCKSSQIFLLKTSSTSQWLWDSLVGLRHVYEGNPSPSEKERKHEFRLHS
jgi:hypothetical protein